MSAEEIYQEFETYLNHVFVNIDSEVKAYNIFDNMNAFIIIKFARFLVYNCYNISFT